METSRGGKPPIGGRPQPCLQTPLQPRGPGVTGQCQPIGVGLVLATVQAGSRVQLIQVVNLMINWFKHFYPKRSTKAKRDSKRFFPVLGPSPSFTPFNRSGQICISCSIFSGSLSTALHHQRPCTTNDPAVEEKYDVVSVTEW